MSTVENLFQERVERLQSGESIEVCSAGLPEQEAELLALVAGLKELDYPEPEKAAVAAQRAEVLRLAQTERDARIVSSGRAERRAKLALPRWFVPVTALSGALTLLFVGVLLAVTGAGLDRLRSRGAETPLAIATERTTVAQVTQAPTSGLRATATATAVAQATQAPTSGLRATATAGQPPTREQAPTATAEPVPQQVAQAARLEAPDAESAVLSGERGLVQVQDADGSWTIVPAEGRIVRAGDHVRTGALSSATLAFYDGSIARLGPNGELSVDELNARRSGGPRIVVLTQSSGESEHDVVSSSEEGARYHVNTPAGTGGAKGTQFTVRITPALIAYFSVDEGAIWVSHLGGTVVVAAGQVTVVRADVAPSVPVFRVTGEGEVQEIGTTWKIAGQVFETHEATVVVGNPQVGDWVHVEGRLLPVGRRVADVIVLLRRSPVNRFTVQGRVEAIGEAEWTVAGRAIAVDEETDVEEGIEEGDLVRVEGVLLEDGTLLAERIVLIEEEAPGLPFHFAGVVQEIGPEAWKISGVSITLDADTEVDEGLAVGDLVEVEGWVLPDSTWLARSIARMEDGERTFEFTGSVESIAPWIVSGIAFETDEWTEVEAGIEVGDTVRVKGRILEDGTWVATEIELLDEDDFLYVEFVGQVKSIDPWVVSGVSLVVDDDTEIEGDIQVGTWVRVRVRVLPDGTWLAVKIAPLDLIERGGCVWFSAIVARVDSDQIVFGNGVTVPLDGSIPIEGEIKANSIVLVLVCVDEDGTLIVVSIVVIYQLETPLVPPTAVAPSPREEGYVTICHKPGTKAQQTKIIPQSALKGHLDHGDTLGPCGE
jgi:hypothetical protein